MLILVVNSRNICMEQKLKDNVVEFIARRLEENTKRGKSAHVTRSRSSYVCL